MPYPPFTEPLTLATLAAQLGSSDAVRLSPEAEQRMEVSYQQHQSAANQFADILANAPLLDAEQAQPAASLLLAYAVGTGAEVPATLVRRMLLLQAHSLSQRQPGVALATVRRLLDFYNREVWPVVYEQGALGAGNDQIPLAHLALPLLGLGEVNYQGYRLAAADVLELFGWAPLALDAPEARVLLGGNQFGLAYATEAVARVEHLGRAGSAIGALAAAAGGAALAGPLGVGPAASAEALLLIHQAIEAAIRATATTELPPIFAAQVSASSNQSLSTALRQLAHASAALGALSAQRTTQLVAGQHGLPLHLAAEPAPGLRLWALPLAAASLVGHNQQLGAAAGVGPALPRAGVETATRRVVENTEQLLGMELLAAAQALDLRHRAAPSATPTSPALAKVFAAFRAHVTFAAHDRLLAPDLHRAAQFVREFAWE
ncbi:MAG: aromatic amino acid lyase [Janthinobacterium lividum]